MKAVVYKGPLSVAVEQVPPPRIETPGDALVRVTTTNICGSDLHMYEGRTNVEQGKVLGHENMGIVEETGPGVSWIMPGDRVSVRSTPHAGPAATASPGRHRSACGPTPPKASTEPRTATPRWGRTRAARPSTYGSRSPTSTCCRCRREMSSSVTSPCCRTSFPPATTARPWLAWSPATRWPCAARARSGCSPRTAPTCAGRPGSSWP
jgi:Alcohol dehydrogenase GroES-like domain/Alcohol dehydrogenase GroES-associated